MSWVRLDDGFADHPKLLAAGPAAGWLWVCALAYCNRQKARDGFVPAAKVRLLADLPSPAKLAATLVEVGLWEPAKGGYRVHDYHHYQPSAEETERTYQAKSAAGRLGGQRSGEARRRSKHEAPASPLLEANEAPASTLLEANEPPASLLRKPDPDPDPRSPRAPFGGYPPSEANQVLLPVPPLGAPLPPELRERVAAVRLATGEQLDADAEWAKFVAHSAERGQLTASLEGSWAKWLARATEFARRDRVRARSSPRNCPVQPVDLNAPWLRAANGDPKS